MDCFYARTNITTDFASEMPIYINNCGYLRRLDKDVSVNRANGRADYHMLFNASGKMLVNGEVLHEGDAYVIYPGEKQEYTYVNKENGLYYYNPGSVTIPKGGNPPTYMLYENRTFRALDFDGGVIFEKSV